MENNNVNVELTNEELAAVEEMAKLPDIDLKKGLKIGAIVLAGTATLVVIKKMIKKYGWPKVKKIIDDIKAKRQKRKEKKALKKAVKEVENSLNVE